MKTILQLSLFTLLFLGTTAGLKAQDKYEYATVKYINPKIGVFVTGLFISISGKEFEKVDVKGDQVKNTHDNTPLLNYIQKMTDNGWKVISTMPVDQNGIGISFILERRKT